MKAPSTKPKPVQVKGILYLDKAPGLSSNHALQRIKRLFNAAKAGHGGTLDPAAEGGLPIMFGPSTKLASNFLNCYKSYEFDMQLGVTTDSGDAEGKITEQKRVPKLSAQDLEKCLAKFRGHIQQYPPIYSAIKYKGKPLYKYARQGIAVPIAPREVHVRSLELIQQQPECLSLRLESSGGFYVRRLAYDIGEELGCGAHVCRLRRSGISALPTEYMVSEEVVQDTPPAERLKLLIPEDKLDFAPLGSAASVQSIAEHAGAAGTKLKSACNNL